MNDELAHARRVRALKDAAAHLRGKPRVDDIAEEVLAGHIQRQIEEHRQAIKVLELQLDLLHLVRHPDDEETVKQVFFQIGSDS
jgi:hypothetical protein